MENDLNNCETYENIYHDKLRQFLEENWSAYSNNMTMLINKIKMVEIKNSNMKIPKSAFPYVLLFLRRLQLKVFLKTFTD